MPNNCAHSWYNHEVQSFTNWVSRLVPWLLTGFWFFGLFLWKIWKISTAEISKNIFIASRELCSRDLKAWWNINCPVFQAHLCQHLAVDFRPVATVFSNSFHRKWEFLPSLVNQAWGDYWSIRDSIFCWHRKVLPLPQGLFNLSLNKQAPGGPAVLSRSVQKALCSRELHFHRLESKGAPAIVRHRSPAKSAFFFFLEKMCLFSIS